MSAFQTILPEQWTENVFSGIGKRWMLICTSRGEEINLMTASWGGFGVLWRKPVSYCFVRPQRYTRELIDPAEGYSLLFFPEEYREQLNLCGTKSGRDMDKVAACGFTPTFSDGLPYVEEADTVVFCRKLYQQDMTPDCFVDDSIPTTLYEKNDFHRTYVGEITKLLTR